FLPRSAPTPRSTSAMLSSICWSTRACLTPSRPLIGPEIYVNPMHHVRIKATERWVHEHLRHSSTAASPWHQDQAAALPEADETDIITVWCPVTDALEEHSCMMVVPGVHHAPMVEHRPAMWFSESELPGAPITLPMRRGDVLFFHRRTPHASTPNVS